MATQLANPQTKVRKNRRSKCRYPYGFRSWLRFERLEERSLLSIIPVQGGTPNYFGPEPNWAYSPLPTVDPVTQVITGGIEKFVDALPGLYVAANTQAQRDINLADADNNLGQYIPVAFSDTTTYAGSEYYEIALVEYREQMSSSLNPTTLRGYVQLETPENAAYSNHYALKYLDGSPILDSNGAQVFGLTAPQYLGPMIVAQQNTPVRITFTNYLPTGEGGDLFLPTDTTVMGSGGGPNMIMPMSVHYMAGDPTVTIHAMDPHNLSVGSLIKLDGFLPMAYNGEFRVTEVVDANMFKITLNSDPGSGVTTLGDIAEMYTQNRATIHLHGGDTVWISDGTQNQWITPAGETTNYPQGVSVYDVPDMPAPGDGSMTFYYSNEQSARLMFYHDHAFGITRLNVYAGEAAGYLLTDAVEQDLIARGIIPAAHIPLIIQDKTFIDPTTVLATDPTWPFPVDGALSNLWMPHVFMPAEDPNVPDGVNPMGRWLYGPWQWPPFPVEHLVIHEITSILVTNGGSGYDALNPPEVTITHPVVDGAGNPINGVTRRPAIAEAVVDPATGKVTAINIVDGGSYEGEPVIAIAPPPTPGVTATAQPICYVTPNVPDLSMGAENFMDTAVINGTAYPYLEVDPTTYEFRILNASDDRFYNLQIVEATSIISSISLTYGGDGYTRAPSVRIVDYLADGVTPGPGIGAKALATLELDPVTGLPTGRIASIEMLAVGSGYVNPQITLVGDNPTIPATAIAKVYGLAPGEDTEVGMVEFAEFQPDGTEWPAGWPTPDHRMGGIPDPNKLGPQIVQIGTEGGFLPTPVVLDNIPLGWDKDPLSITVNNVKEHNLFLGCAERADVIVDFSKFAGKTLIIYSDSPAPVPAGDPRVDYYTNNPDQSAEGGNVSTLPGYGPNVRTLMQIRVRNTTPAAAFDLTNLFNEFSATPADTTGGGAIALASIDATTGAVTAIAPINGGSQYTVAPIVTVEAAPLGGVTATATAHIVGGIVQSITVTNPGRGYTTPPVVTITPAPAKESVFVRGSNPIIVPQAPYNSAYGVTNFPDLYTAYERINSDWLTFQPLDLSTPAVGDLSNEAVTIFNNDKAIIEEWSTEWGRIQTFLGVEVPFTNSTNQTSLWFTVQDPVTEILTDTGDLMTPLGVLGDGTQIWKIAHNGVDTHAIHFHLFNVQVINRIDWAGFVKPPEPNELGWKETVRMNPLETCVVAFRPVSPDAPFGVPESVRLLDPTMPQGSTVGFVPFDANGDPVTTVNDYYNFGWEYVWHCHLLSHEEMDMMRPVRLDVTTAVPGAPVLTDLIGVNQITLNWTDPTPITDPNTLGNPANEIAFRIEVAPYDTGTSTTGTFVPIGTALANSTSYIDYPLAPPADFAYRVVAYNVSGETASNVVIVTGFANQPTVTIDQAPTQPDPAGGTTIHFSVFTGVPVVDFTSTSVTLTGTAPGPLVATVTDLTGAGRNFDVAVTGMTGSGTVIASIGADVLHDAGNNPLLASTSTDNVVNYDGTLPTVTIDQAVAQIDPTSVAPLHFTVVFSEPVIGFGRNDVTLTGTALGAIVESVTGNGTTFDVVVSGMTSSGTVIASIAAGVATDSANNPNLASTSTDNVITYTGVIPTVTINQAATQADPANGTWIHFSVVFNEPVTGFATGSVTLSGTAPGNLVGTVVGSGTTYDVIVSGMTGGGTVIASIAAGVAQDAGGNLSLASTSTDNVVTFVRPGPLGDFDGDGISDVVWHDQTTGDVTGWLIKNGQPTAPVALGNAIPSAWKAAGVGDFNNNGTVGVLWQDRSTGLIGATYRDPGSASVYWTGLGSADPTVWKLSGVGDFNNGGVTGVLWQNQQTGLVGMTTRNPSNGAITWTGLGSADPTAWRIAGVGDFNHGGTTGVLWQNQLTGVIGMTSRNPSNGAITWTGLGSADPAVWSIVGTGDFDNNGVADVLWQDQSVGTVGATWRDPTTHTMRWIGLGNMAPATSTVIGCGDYDGNGSSDVLWHSQSTGNVTAWRVGSLGAIAPNAIGVAPPAAMKAVPGEIPALRAINMAKAAATDSPLTQSDLQPIVREAIARWMNAGLDAPAIARLRQVQFDIVDLPGSYVGETDANRIYLDRNAAGHGWFVDPTPALNEEYVPSGLDHQLQAIDPRALDRIDLLTVVEHELGHVVGFDDLDALSDKLMSGLLDVGVRRTA
jgi:FtsP/CotA-like multicopper oxidase with cupredoxin domain